MHTSPHTRVSLDLVPSDLERLKTLAAETGDPYSVTLRNLIRSAVAERGNTPFDQLWKAAQWSRDSAIADVLTCVFNAGMKPTLDETLKILVAFESAGRPQDAFKFVKEYQSGGQISRDQKASSAVGYEVVAGTSPQAEKRADMPGQVGFSFGSDQGPAEAPTAPTPQHWVSGAPAQEPQEPVTYEQVEARLNAQTAHLRKPTYVNGIPVFAVPDGLSPVNQGFKFEESTPEPVANWDEIEAK